MRKFLFALCLIGCSNTDSTDKKIVDSGNDDAPHNDAGIKDASQMETSINSDASVNADGEVIEGEVPRPYLTKDINHILITGQSNAVALNADITSSTQPYFNVSFDTGVMPMNSCSGEGCAAYQQPSNFIPLVEGDSFFYGSPVETASSSFANEVSRLFSSHSSLISNHGRSGNTYSCLRKGSCNYKSGLLPAFTQGMMEVQSAKDIALAMNKSYIVRAVLAIHGESDHYSYASNISEFPLPGTDGTPNKIKDYSDGMLEWQSDYETSVQEITKQEEAIPLFISQVSGWSGAKTSVVAQMQLDAHTRAPGKVILVAPGYSLPFQSDCRHLTGDGQRTLGKYFAKAYKKVVIDGLTWNPVHPKKIIRQGNELLIKYYVPSLPLVLDTDTISDPGNFGFEYTNSDNAKIIKVNVTSPDTITITFSSELSANGTLSYAQNQPTNGCTGVYGARGNVRDSDELSNWGVLFIAKTP